LANTSSRTREKSGEFTYSSPNSEKQPELLTLEEKDARRLFEGAALLNRMHRYGLLTNEELKLDYVLGLTLNKFLDKRLQTRIYQEGFQAKSIHQARVFIHQRHIKVGKNLVNVNRFLVRTSSEKKINLAPLSPSKPRRPVEPAARKIKKRSLLMSDVNTHASYIFYYQSLALFSNSFVLPDMSVHT
jgi:ribosomal protein uS4